MRPALNFSTSDFSSFTSQRRVGKLFSTSNLCSYISNQFCVDPVSVYIGTGGQEELIHIQSDKTAKMNIR